MKQISRWLDRFCYEHPNFGIPNLMRYVAIGNVVVFLLDLFSDGMFSAIIAFYPSQILRGQIWRLVSFVFIPVNSSMIFFIFSVMFYLFLGGALEQRWGTAKFTVFYLTGVVLNILTGFILYFALGQPQWVETAGMHYVNMSMFFAYATLYPDMQFLIYFIIPVKAKWLAWLDAAYFAVAIVLNLIQGSPLMALLPVVGILNYFLYFWDDLTQLLWRGRRRADPKVIQFQRARREIKNRKGYLHKCAVCGLTDADEPTMEFRYCSKCNGYYCYCMKHINNHVHIQ